MIKMSWWNPTEQEREMVKRVGSKILKEINDEIRKNQVSVISVNLVGSTALDTFVRNDHDFDIFVVASKEATCAKVRKMFQSLHPRGHVKGAKFVKGEELKGLLMAWDTKVSFPEYPNAEFEVDEICITTDHPRFATVRHTDIYSTLPQEQRQEIRKMKALLKSHGIYGAERGAFSSIAVSESIREFGTIENFCKFFRERSSFPELEDPAQSGRDVFGSIKAQNQLWISKIKHKLYEACRDGILDHQYGKADFISDNTGNKIVAVSCPTDDKTTNFGVSLRACTTSINAVGQKFISNPRCDVFIDKGENKCMVAFGFDLQDRNLGPHGSMASEVKRFRESNPNAQFDPVDERWYAPLRVDKSALEKKVLARIVNGLKPKQKRSNFLKRFQQSFM